ncbi:MAG: 50S ribosomal protein L22 [Parcubacteria group bacterium GW2011_GWA2_47_12]|nr:MAG: 50S ribosomal protein L22 [Parcubacteria group bacterium GW2011_GWA2_47_12]
MSPRKVRLVADTVRGKSVADARAVLSFMPKVSALPLLKLLNSAEKNAMHTSGASDASALKVK